MLLWLSVGCDNGGAVTPEQFAQVAEGMSLDQVEALFGEGGDQFDPRGAPPSVTYYRWTSEAGDSYVVMFTAGKVANKRREG